MPMVPSPPPGVLVFKCREIVTEQGTHLYEFDCPWCMRPHRHGAGYGHRWPHCSVPGGPFAEMGYYLLGPHEWTHKRRAPEPREGRALYWWDGKRYHATCN